MSLLNRIYKNKEFIDVASPILENEEFTKTKEIFEIAKQLGNFDQLLFEKNSKGSIWVHISYKDSGNRKQCIDNYNVK